MNKKTYFYIDDVIWTLRDLTREKPESLFDNPFLKMLKEAHNKYGMKVQLNLFWRTSYFYGMDEFSLADVTDAYKAEWEAASDWLKLSFHAKEEFPDYPHLNAKYEDVYKLFKDTQREIFRFAGEKSFAYGICPHWMPISREGILALRDCGAKITNVTVGEVSEYNGDPASLPYGHAMRLLNNRQPEAKVFTRNSRDTAIANSICAYNHLTTEQVEKSKGLKTIYDEETGMHFKEFALFALNLIPYDEIESDFAPHMNEEFFGFGTHEQYFYPDYLAYQPHYGPSILKACEIVAKNGFEFLFIDELVK